MSLCCRGVGKDTNCISLFEVLSSEVQILYVVTYMDRIMHNLCFVVVTLAKCYQDILNQVNGNRLSPQTCSSSTLADVVVLVLL